MKPAEYDVNNFYFSDFYYSIKEKIKFLIDYENGTTFGIPETEYFIYVTPYGCNWFEYIDHNEKFIIRTSFEEVLNSVSDDLKSKLLFHINIFKKTDSTCPYFYSGNKWREVL